MKRCVGMVGALCLALGIPLGWYAIQPESPWRSGPEWRTLTDVFAIHRNQGWSVVRGPSLDQKYCIVGGVCNNDPRSTNEFVSGSFRLGDGRRVSFKVPKPPGVEVEVDGLEPEDGGALQYAVLHRPYGTRAMPTE